ncbi:BrnT family toxin [Nostoc sp.]|uniref:BrnT family toxin n=1 Tax=Nostoc sp. TaxID=1180 RepID=UPI002FF8952C
MIQFTWDENKQQSNLSKHGFDFVDASQVFEGATFTFEDERYAYGEQRFMTYTGTIAQASGGDCPYRSWG